MRGANRLGLPCVGAWQVDRWCMWISPDIRRRARATHLEPPEMALTSAMDAAATHATMVVFVLPPKESASSRVSFESRYGMCFAALFVSAATTLPSAANDALMYLHSSRRWPLALDTRRRSEPARSTRLSLEERKMVPESRLTLLPRGWSNKGRAGKPPSPAGSCARMMRSLCDP
eukprot:scaffold198078_cov27-Tisochrysis_lutea.AAC.4